jgi:hypothetical protein
LSAPISGALVMSSDLHSPSGFSTLRIKAFDQLHHDKLALPGARLSFAPRRALFRYSLRINARNPSSSCLANRSGAESSSNGFSCLSFQKLRDRICPRPCGTPMSNRALPFQPAGRTGDRL